jgi:hypothetical protein
MPGRRRSRRNAGEEVARDTKIPSSLVKPIGGKK